MNVVVMIQGREAIPVRAIPLLTNWRFMSPDIVAHVLGGTGGSNVSVFGGLESYRMENGQVLPVAEDWWAQFPLKKLRALPKKIKETESIDEAGYSTWQELSLKELPAGVFVWKDDYQKLHDKNWNDRFRMTYCALKDWNGEETDEDVESQMQRDLRTDDLVDDNPLKRDLRESLEVLKRWREPDYCPFVGQELSVIVREGFVLQITTERVKQMESAEYKSAIVKIEDAERLLRDANQNLIRRQETLKNAPGTGDIQKLEDAERAVQVAESALANANKVHETMRGDFLDEPQQLAPEPQAATVVVESASGGEERNKAGPQHLKPWLIADSKDPAPKLEWYTSARYFARQLVKDDSTLLLKKRGLASKVVLSLTNVGIYKRGGNKPFDASTVLKAFVNVTLG